MDKKTELRFVNVILIKQLLWQVGIWIKLSKRPQILKNHLVGVFDL